MKSMQLFVAGCMFLWSTSFGQPLNGVYTINSALPTSGTNFHSFNDFSAGLHTYGISGNVTVSVTPGSGPYTEQVNFDPVTGSGPGAVILLEGNGELIKAATTTNDRHVVRLTDQSYFTINNLHVARETSSSGGFYGIHIFNTGNHITISNCEVDITGTTSTLYGGYVASGSLTSILETGDFHNITFTGNKSTGGGYGVSLFGLVSNLASGIYITNNELDDFHSNGVYLRETNGAVISGNTLRKMTSAITSANAIQIAQAANINAQIFNNFIEISQTNNGSMTFRGIYLFNGTGHKVYNNVIHSVMLTSGDFTGIEIRTGGTAPEIYYNTISIDNTATTTGDLAGIKEELSNTNAIIRNNNISISQPTSGNKAALLLGSLSSLGTAFNSNYNILWVPGGHVGQKGGGFTTPVFYTTLTDWQNASGQDLQSVSIDPQLASLALPVPSNPAVNNLGTPIAGITTDVMGITRGNPPDIGAFEWSPGPPPAPVAIIGDTVVCDNDIIQVYMVNPVAGATSYNWSAGSGMQILSGQGSSTIHVNTATGGLISVYASNNSGNSAAISINISVVSHTVAGLNLPFTALCNTSQPVLLSGGSPAGGNYSGTAVSAGVFTPTIAGIGQHQIVYTIIDTNDCTDTASGTLAVVYCPSTNDLEKTADVMSVYPNPFTGSFYLKYPAGFYEGVLVIYTGQGNLLKSYRVRQGDNIFNMKEIDYGIYYFVLNDSRGKTYSMKVIKSTE